MKWFFRQIIKFLHLELNTLYDYYRFKKNYSLSTDNKKDKKNLEAWILQDKHRIEKGLSLPKPRYFFGEEPLQRLATNMVKYSNSYEKDSVYFFGIGALKAYEQFHLVADKSLPQFFVLLKSQFNEDDFNHKSSDLVGLGKIDGSNPDDERFFRDFALSRHSCRNFNIAKDVPNKTIESIMKLAIKAPSVCNRQHWHVHFLSGQDKLRVLDLQNGNTGFADNIPYIAVITSDLRSFYSADERNQPFVDGGIFAMNLMYSMHSYGISSCPLNWCNSFVMDRRFHKLGYTKASETVIMLLAFGYPNNEGFYAKSPRMAVEDFYTINVNSK